MLDSRRAMGPGLRRQSRGSCITFKRWIVKMRRQRECGLLFVLLLNGGLLMAGGFAMRRFEEAHEILMQRELDDTNIVLANYLGNCSLQLCPDLLNTTSVMLQVREGLQRRVGHDELADWDLPGSLIFVASVMTTIGYGDQHPMTKNGQYFTVFFGSIAIPAMFLMLAVIGEILLNFCRWMNKITFAKCGRSYRNAEGGPKQRFTIAWTAILVFSYLIGSAYVFWKIPTQDNKLHPFESVDTPQTLEQAFYFAFITFSTVGLGDFSVEVAGKAATTALLLTTMFFGVSVFSSFIAVVNQTVQKLVIKADYLIITTREGGGGDDEDEDEDDDLVHILTERTSTVEANGNTIGARKLRPLSMDLGGWKFESRPPSPEALSPSVI